MNHKFETSKFGDCTVSAAHTTSDQSSSCCCFGVWRLVTNMSPGVILRGPHRCVSCSVFLRKAQVGRVAAASCRKEWTPAAASTVARVKVGTSRAWRWCWSSTRWEWRWGSAAGGARWSPRRSYIRGSDGRVGGRRTWLAALFVNTAPSQRIKHTSFFSHIISLY